MKKGHAQSHCDGRARRHNNDPSHMISLFSTDRDPNVDPKATFLNFLKGSHSSRTIVVPTTPAKYKNNDNNDATTSAQQERELVLSLLYAVSF